VNNSLTLRLPQLSLDASGGADVRAELLTIALATLEVAPERMSTAHACAQLAVRNVEAECERNGDDDGLMLCCRAESWRTGARQQQR
jgi:hypothetical protein